MNPFVMLVRNRPDGKDIIPVRRQVSTSAKTKYPSWMSKCEDPTKVLPSWLTKR